MLKRLKNHNDLIFIIFLIFLFAVSTWVVSNNIQQRINSLVAETQKIDKQKLFFTKHNNGLQQQRESIVDNINSYLKLQKNLSDNNTEELKKTLLENSKSSELLAILPPSEIAQIQQKELLKTIHEDITDFKEKSAFVWQSIYQLNSHEYNAAQFAIGNIQDNNVKDILSQSINDLLKKEKPIFTSVAKLNSDIENFSSDTENFKQFFPLLSLQQEKNKNTINSTIDSLSEHLATAQLFAIVGLLCLISLLVFVIFRKKHKKTTALLDNTELIEQVTVLDETPVVSLLTNNDKTLSLFNEINHNLSKHINLHFDSDMFHTLPVKTQETISDIINEFIKFSLVYSFDMRDFGDVIVSLYDDAYTTKLVYKDNGKGLVVEDVKHKIKQQYNVNESIFLGKSDQQLLSFIFKPGFELIKQDKIYSFNLSSINNCLKELQGNMSIHSQENHGVEFVITIPKL